MKKSVQTVLTAVFTAVIAVGSVAGTVYAVKGLHEESLDRLAANLALLRLSITDRSGVPPEQEETEMILEVSTETETEPPVTEESITETEYERVVFSLENFSFRSGEAVFKDYDKALENAGPIVDFLNKEWNGKTIVLVGCTSSWRDPVYSEEQSREKDMELSGQRAEAVKALLTEKGMRADLILCYGAGSESAFYIMDRDPAVEVSDSNPNANFIAEKGDLNRVVYAVPNDDVRVKDFMASLYEDVLQDASEPAEEASDTEEDSSAAEEETAEETQTSETVNETDTEADASETN